MFQSFGGNNRSWFFHFVGVFPWCQSLWVIACQMSTREHMQVFGWNFLDYAAYANIPQVAGSLGLWSRLLCSLWFWWMLGGWWWQVWHIDSRTEPWPSLAPDIFGAPATTYSLQWIGWAISTHWFLVICVWELKPLVCLFCGRNDVDQNGHHHVPLSM